MTSGDITEFLLESLEGTEVTVDQLSSASLRLTTGVGGQAVPVEGMVPDLSGQVVNLASGGGEMVIETLLANALVGLSSVVQLGDITGMVLAIMEVDGLRRGPW